MNAFTTCLWFDTRGEEAAKFYTNVFPNSSLGSVTPYVGGERDGQVMTVDFVLNGQQFIALNGGPEFTFDEAISFQIPCADQDEVDHYWDTLTEGGEESQCGWLKDKFGVSWQVVPTRFTSFQLRRPGGGGARRAGAVPDEEDHHRRPGGGRGRLIGSGPAHRRTADGSGSVVDGIERGAFIDDGRVHAGAVLPGEVDETAFEVIASPARHRRRGSSLVG